MNKRCEVILVVGPTASGKSHFAQELAESHQGEILNADSQQCYRGLMIGTGKVPPEERRVPHWILESCAPGAYMTAQDFTQEADSIIQRLQKEAQTPIVVGGTGLYVRALLEGLDRLPARDEGVRKKLKEELEDIGPQEMHERLQQIDPSSAEIISPQDTSRLIRYLEIHTLSGKAPSQLFSRGRPGRLRYATKSYWLKPKREENHRRIEQRVRAMIAAGWAEEVRGLMSRGQDPRNWQNKPIGYGDLAEFLSDGGDLADIIDRIVKKTRQYAKRQETFFRGLFKNPAYQSHGSQLFVIN